MASNFYFFLKNEKLVPGNKRGYSGSQKFEQTETQIYCKTTTANWVRYRTNVSTQIRMEKHGLSAFSNYWNKCCQLRQHHEKWSCKQWNRGKLLHHKLIPRNNSAMFDAQKKNKDSRSSWVSRHQQIARMIVRKDQHMRKRKTPYTWVVFCPWKIRSHPKRPECAIGSVSRKERSLIHRRGIM